MTISDNETLDFLYLNEYQIENERIYLYPPSCRLFRSYLFNDPLFLKSYVERFIRRSKVSVNSFHFDDWHLDIFRNWNEFEQLLLDSTAIDENLKRIILDTKKSQTSRDFSFPNKGDKEFVEKLIKNHKYEY